MEQIIKISSEQGFSEQWVAADRGSAGPTLKLVDFIIPGNTGTYNLGDCFINLNMELVNTPNANGAIGGANGILSTDTALYNNDIYLEQNENTTISQICDCASLVRNAEMFSSERGMVESIQRVNILRQTLWNMENDKAEQRDGNNNLGGSQGRRGVGQQTSSMVQIMGGNVNVAGQADTSIQAQGISRDFRINLSDLFGVGSALWNSDVYGSTRIHLELDMGDLNIVQLGGIEDATDFVGQGKNWGEIITQTAVVATTIIGQGNNPLVTAIVYDDYQLNLPFYVGQLVVVGFTIGATLTEVTVVISAIKYGDGTNNTNPPSNTAGNVQIFTRTPVHTVPAGAAQTLSDIFVKAALSTAATAGAVPGDQIRVNNAEIVLTNLPTVVGPDSIDYTTYSTEEVQGNNQLTFNKQIICEPNAQNLIVVNSDSGQNDINRLWTNYRLAINNEDVAGNRDINIGSTLHRDRVLRFFNNRSQNVSNMSFNTVQANTPQGAPGAAGGGTTNQGPFGPILETLPITQQSKIVNIKLSQSNGADPTKQGAQDVTFFKELVSTI